MGDTLLVYGSTQEKNFPIWMSTNPKANEWKEAVDTFQLGAWDPDFFLDTDNRLYLYWGSSNFYPLYGIEVDRKKLQPIGERKELLHLHDSLYGWQRFGEYLDNTFLDPFMEGAWMTKHNGKYYLQYGAPGTEFSGYGDGVSVSNHPLGPFVNQPHNPFSYKPGGFARGAGHGNTFQDKWNNWWHISTMVVNVKNNFERRLGLWPVGFDSDDVLYCNTAFGDYPHYLAHPDLPGGKATNAQHRLNQDANTISYSLKKEASEQVIPPPGEPKGAGTFTGWMLLNYNKPVQVSSTLGDYNANNAVDESIKTYWSAATGNKGEWLQSDLGNICTVNAIQINYADQDVDTSFLGKIKGIYHQYCIYQSNDGKTWKLLVDKSNNKTDVPHDYVELNQPVQTRYIKLENIHMPTGKFAISGLRIFGQGSGAVPDTVKNFIVLRTEKDKRSAWLKWRPVNNAYAYNIYIGVAPDKLYTSIMVYGNTTNEYYFKAMDRNLPYYFSIEAINENGVSKRTAVMKVE